MKKSFLIFIVLLFVFSGTLAENIDIRFTELTKLDLSMQAELVKYGAFHGETLKALKQWVDFARADIHIKDDAALAELYYKDSPLMYFYKDENGFQLDDMHYYQGTDSDFYGLIKARDPLNKYRNVKAVFLAAPIGFENLCLNMADMAETKKGGTTIKKLVKPAETQTFILDGAVLQSYWQSAVESFKTALKKNSPDEMFINKAINKLKLISFEGKCTVRQFISDNGKPFAWRFNGYTLLDGVDKRKTSLTFGKTQEGFYIKLDMPAEKGKNKININAAGSFKNDKLLSDGNFIFRDENINTSGKFDISLNILNGLKGKIDYRIKRKDDKEKRYLINPALKLDERNISGKIKYKYTLGERETSLNFIAKSIEPKTFTKSKSVVKMSELSESALLFERQRLSGVLSRPLAQLLSDVQKEQRPLVLHEITRLFRLNDENLKPLNLPQYTVIQEEP
ncbi:MAG: hypothetical protein Q4E07_00135 [Eubacteriales bacterium]|nr:hypothetical protein [Eubacteriales bacterium]